MQSLTDLVFCFRCIPLPVLILLSGEAWLCLFMRAQCNEQHLAWPVQPLPPFCSTMLLPKHTTPGYETLLSIGRQSINYPYWHHGSCSRAHWPAADHMHCCPLRKIVQVLPHQQWDSRNAPRATQYPQSHHKTLPIANINLKIIVFRRFSCIEPAYGCRATQNPPRFLLRTLECP